MTDELTLDGRVPLRVGLVRARTHIVFIFGLLTAGGIIIATDRVTEHVGAPRAATAAEREAAAFAWTAASRSTSKADVDRARRLAQALGVAPGATTTVGGLSPSAGLAALEDLSAAAGRPTTADSSTAPASAASSH